MANRYMNQFKYSLEKGVAYLYFNATIGATGAITVNGPRSKGVLTIVRTGAGAYTITLKDKYNRLLDLNISQLIASGSPATLGGYVLRTVAVTNATPTIQIAFLDATGANVDPASGVELRGTLTLKNSTV